MDLQIVETTQIDLTETSAKKTYTSLAEYQKELRPHLPEDLNETQPFRLIYIGLFLATITLLAFVGITSVTSPLIKILIGCGLGYCYAGLAFLAHELFHGSIIKNTKWQIALGTVIYTPLFISPTFWKYWHNYLHHNFTQHSLRDPDAFPTMVIFKNSKFLQTVYKWTPGSESIRSFGYLFFWFSYQSFMNQIDNRFKLSLWKKVDHQKVNIELAIQAMIIAGFLYLIGPSQWLYFAVIPFLVQNYLLMSYITTNHNISPLTSKNDPLMNSLTVTNHPLLEKIHFNFGYHVEHHLFPTMSPAKAKLVHEKLKEVFPETYKSMPKFSALKKIYSSGRIYKDATTLINPLNGKEQTTI